MLLDAYSWTGTLEQVLTAVRGRAVAHAADRRAAADNGSGPAVALLADGVADAFERALAEPDASRAFNSEWLKPRQRRLVSVARCPSSPPERVQCWSGFGPGRVKQR
jgi:hypothetical protein